MPADHIGDHDLLIRLDQKVDSLTQKVSNLTDDHERRIRFLERWVWGAIAVLYVANALLALYIVSKH